VVLVREQPTRCFGRRLMQHCGAWNEQSFCERPGCHVPRMMTWASEAHVLPMRSLLQVLGRWFAVGPAISLEWMVGQAQAIRLDVLRLNRFLLADE
jgi:hypothetical protein